LCALRARYLKPSAFSMIRLCTFPQLPHERLRLALLDASSVDERGVSTKLPTFSTHGVPAALPSKPQNNG
jgi:hypothetical protein